MKGMPLPTPQSYPHAVQHRTRGIVEIYDCFVALEVTAGHQLFAGGRLKYVAKHGHREETSNSFDSYPTMNQPYKLQTKEWVLCHTCTRKRAG